MILYSAIDSFFISKSELKIWRQFGRQHNRVRHGGGGISGKVGQ